MHPRTEQSLHDVLDACLEIEEYLSDVTFHSYRIHRRLQLTIERLFIIVGEALRRAELQDSAVVRSIPYLRNIISMRHRIVHDYDAIDQRIIWTAASRHVPALKSQVARILQVQV